MRIEIILEDNDRANYASFANELRSDASDLATIASTETNLSHLDGCLDAIALLKRAVLLRKLAHALDNLQKETKE